MSINSVGSNGPVLAGAGIFSGAGLDGDTLLTYCSNQLNEMNAQIKTAMVQQETARRQKGLCNDLRGELAKYSNGMGQCTPKEKAAISEKYEKLLAELPPGAQRNAVLSSYNQFRSSAYHSNGKAPDFVENKPGVNIGTDLGAEGRSYWANQENSENMVTPDEMRALIKDVENVGDELGKGSELDMINLQQLVSFRQNVIQQTTSLMSKFNQSLEAIVANFGK